MSGYCVFWRRTPQLPSIHFARLQETDFGKALLGQLEINLIGRELDVVAGTIQGNVVGIFVGQLLDRRSSLPRSKRAQPLPGNQAGAG